MGINKPNVRFRRSLRSAEKSGELLPGNRPRRTRRIAERMRVAVQREPTSSSKRDSSRKRAKAKRGSRASSCSKWSITPRRANAGAPCCCAISASNTSNASCDGCDNCLAPRETFDGTVPAQKFLSCVHRVCAKSGFGFGLNHIVDVLRGADTEMIRQRSHDELSTYGIGGDLKRAAWQAIGRELLRLGFIECASGKFATLTLTPLGREALRNRTTDHADQTCRCCVQTSKGNRGRDRMRRSSFRTLARSATQIGRRTRCAGLCDFFRCVAAGNGKKLSHHANEFRRIPGVGEQKLRDLSEPFLVEIKDYVAEKSRARLNDSQLETRVSQSGESIEQIARARGLVTGTIYFAPGGRGRFRPAHRPRPFLHHGAGEGNRGRV